jgi:opacity protein-like surface antigen
MKKLIYTAAMLAALATTAQAQESKPYVGIDYLRTVASYNSNLSIGGGDFLNVDTLLNDNLDGLNIHVGNRFHKNFGAELGYFRTREEGKNIAAGTTVGPGLIAGADFSTDVMLQGITLDGLGYLPLGESKKVELIGTAGASWSKGEVTIEIPGIGSGSDDESEFGFRLGAGAQVNLTDKINLRGLARYQSADFSGAVDDLWVYSLGANYSF